MENGVKNCYCFNGFYYRQENKEKIYWSEEERFIQSECYEELSLIILI